MFAVTDTMYKLFQVVLVLVPKDLHAILNTPHAMVAEIGTRVIISKEIEVTTSDIPKTGFRALVDKPC
jgi:hypothetical protein